MIESFSISFEVRFNPIFLLTSLKDSSAWAFAFVLLEKPIPWASLGILDPEIVLDKSSKIFKLDFERLVSVLMKGLD